MSIGQNTYWIILRVQSNGVPDVRAELEKFDKRQALKFHTYELAHAYIRREWGSNEEYWAIEVRG